MLYKRKLIRTKIAEERKMKPELSIPYYDKEVREFLAKKILEEAQEVAEEILCDRWVTKGSLRRDRLKEELGDLYDISQGVMRYFGISQKGFHEAREAKVAKKGDFSQFYIWKKPTKLGRLVRPLMKLVIKLVQNIRSFFLAGYHTV